MHPLTALRKSTVDRGAIESLDVQCGRNVGILLVTFLRLSLQKLYILEESYLYIYIIFDCMLDKQLMGAVPGESPISSWLYIITGC